MRQDSPPPISSTFPTASGASTHAAMAVATSVGCTYSMGLSGWVRSICRMVPRSVLRVRASTETPTRRMVNRAVPDCSRSSTVTLCRV